MNLRVAGRTPLFCANWKMNLSVDASVALASQIDVALRKTMLPFEVVLAPSFVSLQPVFQVLKGGPIALAAQTCASSIRGAYTGEVSVEDLQKIGCQYVIVGHSERRRYLGDTNQDVNQKLLLTLAHGMSPILCIGETENYAQSPSFLSNRSEKELEFMLLESLLKIESAWLEKIVIAYEPVFAIGTGVAATPAYAQSVHLFIRNCLKKHFGQVADRLRIVYGGSVTSAHVGRFLECPDIDGALIGGASLVAESFLDIVRYHKEKE